MAYEVSCPDCKYEIILDDPGNTDTIVCPKCEIKSHVYCDESYDPETGDEYFWFALEKE